MAAMAAVTAIVASKEKNLDELAKKNEQLDMVKSIIDSLVIEENQLQVDKWKCLSRDGKLTEEQAKQAFTHVYNEAKDIIEGSSSLKDFMNIFADKDGLKTLIEESVNRNKNTFLTVTSETISKDVDQSVKTTDISASNKFDDNDDLYL